MARRIVYINPGDIVELRVIDDPDLPCTAREWANQTRPAKMAMQYHAHNRLSLQDLAVEVDYTFEPINESTAPETTVLDL